MNRFLFNHSIWPGNQKHLVSFWLSMSKIEYIPGNAEDQMFEKELMRHISEPFLFFNEPLPNVGDPAASHCTKVIEYTSMDSSRLQLNIKQL